MKSGMFWQKDAITGAVRFEGHVAAEDLARIKFNPVDRKVLDGCGTANATAADWLLALELIFRRAQEQLTKEPQ